MKRKFSSESSSSYTKRKLGAIMGRGSKTNIIGKYKARGKRVRGISTLPLVSSLQLHPFPPEFRKTISWAPSSALLIPGATSGAIQIQTNSIYDPDVSNALGNFQPLFFDQLLSATGPYQLYRVDAWKCRWEIINVSAATSEGSAMALDCYLGQGAISATDTDTWSELANTPGTVTFLLGPPGTENAKKVVNLNGRTVDYMRGGDDANFNGAYNANPLTPLYMALAYKNAYPADAGTGVKVYVKLTAEFDVTFFARDAVQS